MDRPEHMNTSGILCRPSMSADFGNRRGLCHAYSQDKQIKYHNYVLIIIKYYF